MTRKKSLCWVLELPLAVRPDQAKHLPPHLDAARCLYVEGKRNDTGMRFVLQRAEEGNQGSLLWGEDHIPALIDWNDPLVAYGLRQRVKYARLDSILVPRRSLWCRVQGRHT